MKKQVLNAGSVELLDWMGGDKAIVRGGRICYQSQGNEQSDINLVKALVKNNHTSALEHTVFTFQVKAPISVIRQWMRSRIGCLTGDSVITFVNNQEESSDKLKFTIAELYDKWTNGEKCSNSVSLEDIEAVDKLLLKGVSLRSACEEVGIARNTYKKRKEIGMFGKKSCKSRIKNMKIRVLNENTKRFTTGHINEVIYSGYKDIYKVTTESSHSLKSTYDHKYLTPNGWFTLQEIIENGYEIYVSGHSNTNLDSDIVVDYKEEWKPIVGYDGKYEISNYGRVKSLVDTHNKPLKNPVIKSLTVSKNNRLVVSLSKESKTVIYQVSRLVAKHFINNENGNPYVCHKDDNFMNNYISNLYWGNEETNKNDMKNNYYNTQVKLTKIISCEYLGKDDVYDISVDKEFHNFVANGIIVHNCSYNEMSLRYCDAKMDFFVPDDLPENMKLEWLADCKHSFNVYLKWKKYLEENPSNYGDAKELARNHLGVGIYSEFIFTCNGASLLHFEDLRTSKGASKLIQNYAWTLLDCVKEIAPIYGEALETRLGRY